MKTIDERYLGHVMTVGELREALRDLPDAMPAEGQYGEDLRLDVITEIPEGGDPAAPLRPEPRRFVRVTY